MNDQLYAVFCASNTACELLQLLPRGDLVEDLKELMETQFDILYHLIQGKHIGSDNVDDFVNFTVVLMDQAHRSWDKI